VAAVELPVPRGKLKNRIKTFLGNPLCRGVDELCTELLNARDSLMASSFDRAERLRGVLSQTTGLLRENLGLQKLNARPGKENDKLDLDLLVIFVSREIETQACQVLQSESVLMHYNEIQARSAEVEAMAMNFEQRVADAVAKAGLRAKPGPKKEAGSKGTIGRGKPNHSE
jgi:hypothetical protein